MGDLSAGELERLRMLIQELAPEGPHYVTTDEVDLLVRMYAALKMTIAPPRGAMAEALRPFVDAYRKSADPVGDSDLYPEQPRAVYVTLGDCRKADRILREAISS